MPYDKSLPYACPCCGYWNGDMKYDYYKHLEPLIKDKKIRKAVRAWAEANEDGSTTKLKFDEDNLRLSSVTSCIEFDEYPPFDRLEDTETYTIAELCGEEEAPEPLEPTFVDMDERIKEKASAEKLYKGENDMHLTEEGE